MLNDGKMDVTFSVDENKDLTVAIDTGGVEETLLTDSLATEAVID